ncbi:MAG: hypothetical protein JOZ31_02940 [Verrucomicrobia bacterium]|nr:hypothetical protein [Verrucomicrobiota bacterium]MBV8483288.1 hypothetical protein [Verrucomicrobiota bacterium]
MQSTLTVLLLCLGLLASKATAGNPITVQLRGGLSNPIYVEAGTVTINFSALLAYGGIRMPWNGEAANVIVYNTSGDSLATLQISNAVDIWNAHGGSGTVTWNNPVAQYIQISGLIYFDGDVGHSPFYWFYLPGGTSVASGGDTPPGGGNGITTQNPTSPASPPVTPIVSTSIHAVIISGLSDPAKVIASPNVTLTGGIVALGKAGDSSSLPSSWRPGVRIVPDYDLLTGTKIPPVTPNIIDVRIVRQQARADFPSAQHEPGN